MYFSINLMIVPGILVSSRFLISVCMFIVSKAFFISSATAIATVLFTVCSAVTVECCVCTRVVWLCLCLLCLRLCKE